MFTCISLTLGWCRADTTARPFVPLLRQAGAPKQNPGNPDAALCLQVHQDDQEATASQVPGTGKDRRLQLQQDFDDAAQGLCSGSQGSIQSQGADRPSAPPTTFPVPRLSTEAPQLACKTPRFPGSGVPGSGLSGSGLLSRDQVMCEAWVDEQADPADWSPQDPLTCIRHDALVFMPRTRPSVEAAGAGLLPVRFQAFVRIDASYQTKACEPLLSASPVYPQ